MLDPEAFKHSVILFPAFASLCRALQLNQLTGTIPAEWSTMQSLADVRFGNNSLSGQIPPVLGESWTGPASSTEKLQVQLMNNPGLCGSLPAEWMPKDPADSGSSLNGTGYLAYAVIKNTGIEAGEACASSESPVLASPPALLPVPQSAPPRPPTYDAEEEGLSGGGVAAAILGTLLAVAVILVGIVICMQVRWVWIAIMCISAATLLKPILTAPAAWCCTGALTKDCHILSVVIDIKLEEAQIKRNHCLRASPRAPVTLSYMLEGFNMPFPTMQNTMWKVTVIATS
eukprot:350266-Chlamydomonas_euryale.AAC.8